MAILAKNIDSQPWRSWGADERWNIMAGYQKGLSMEALAKRYGHTVDEIEGFLRSKKMLLEPHRPKQQRWAEAEEKLAAKMLLEGKSMREVAETLGRSYGSVHAWLQRVRTSYGWQMSKKQVLLRILGLVDEKKDETTEPEALTDFEPMLTVDIRTGEVLLDRMREVLGYDYSER